MPEYVADDVVAIAARLKEIEEEKRKAREAPPPPTNELAAEENAAKDCGDIYAGW